MANEKDKEMDEKPTIINEPKREFKERSAAAKKYFEEYKRRVLEHWEKTIWKPESR